MAKSFYILLFVLLVHAHSQWTYSIINSTTDPSHSYFTAALKYDGTQDHWTNQTNKDSQYLNFTYFFMSPSHLIVRITDLTNPNRWEVPHEHPFPHSDYKKKFAPYDNGLVKVTITQSPFYYKITRKSTNEVIFDSSVGDLIYSDYYLQFSTSLATPNVYGFGERALKLNLGPDGTYSILTRDAPVDLEVGESGHSLYGYHPVSLMREQSNAFSMALLRSSVPMDLVFEGGKKLTYKVVGGIIDLNFFLGGDVEKSPETVIKQYHAYLGGWTLQPFWSFGYHQSRWGFKSSNQMATVVRKFGEYGIPLDVIWSDIDYMRAKIDFTVDTQMFNPAKMRTWLTQYQKRWVPIIDAGIAVNNEIHTIGLNNDVYIKVPNGTDLLGEVWPGYVNYPDWFNPNTSMFWDLCMEILQQQIPFSGIWLDMNEASNFVPGEVGFVPDLTDLRNFPPYKPTGPEDFIFTKAMRMDAVHYGNISELYAHNTYSLLQSKATYNYLKIIDSLVFILTRSSFYGSGRFVAHWTGDNMATYEYLALSIPTVINSGIFGMPMAGADICGFEGDTTEELCSRWYQLGVLYPFSRNHNSIDNIDQEPWAFGPTLLETASVNIHFKYATVKHYYAQFLKQGGTGLIFKPVFFEFPADSNLYKSYVDTQVMIGEALMAAPALSQGQTTVDVYFPQDTWFDLITGELIRTSKQPAGVVTRDAPFNATAPIFLRGGHLLAIQNTTSVSRTDDLSNDFKLEIGFKETNNAGVYSATGEMIGLKSFDDHNVLTKCKLDNCLYTVNATMEVSESDFSVKVIFYAQGTAQNYEQVTISELLMSGDWSDKLGYFDDQIQLDDDGRLTVADNMLVYKFNAPFNVKPGVGFNISIPKRRNAGLIIDL